MVLNRIKEYVFDSDDDNYTVKTRYNNFDEDGNFVGSSALPNQHTEYSKKYISIQDEEDNEVYATTQEIVAEEIDDLEDISVPSDKFDPEEVHNL